MTPTEPSPNILLVHPRTAGSSFWNYRATLQAVGRRYANTPLGMITVAGLLPSAWPVRLVDRNVEELSAADLDWADIVGTGGMLSQQRDALEIVRLAKERGRYVVVGGPDPSASPQVYASADARLVGEAEGLRERLIQVLERREPRVLLRSQGYPDLATSPIPRFDLLKLDRYLHVGVQASRGCPHGCEFCSVVEIYGRRPRIKSSAQVLAELEALYRIGYRGHVDFVDDNLVGDRRAARRLLRDLVAWLEDHHQPFEFTTEASLNLADDEELLALMRRANFFAIFAGVETPDEEALRASNKRQNLGRDLVASVRKIQRAGIFVNGGFIVGFDTERSSVTDAIVECIEAAAMPVGMVGLLYALPGTELARRLSREGRLEGLFDDFGVAHSDDADQCTSGLNFRTRRPKSETFADYREIYRRLYRPRAYYGRVRRLVRMMDRSASRFRPTKERLLWDLGSFARISLEAGWRNRETRAEYWRSLADALLHNPRAVRFAVLMAGLYLHFGPFSRHLDAVVRRRLAELEREAVPSRSRPTCECVGAETPPLPG